MRFPRLDTRFPIRSSALPLALGSLLFVSPGDPTRAQSRGTFDPAAWGSDHVGKTFPNYLTGEECMFCHRDAIGRSWTANWHNRALRVATPDSAALRALGQVAGFEEAVDEISHLIEGPHQVRYLKPNGRYGQLALLSARWVLDAENGEGHMVGEERATWDGGVFADSCAGCHATAVDRKLRAFSFPAIDCFTCHGEVPHAHEDDTDLVFFAKRRGMEARVEISICGQCHLRGGRSRSTGLPYPNTFVPGDNLFMDFDVDFSSEHLQGLNPGDRHVYQTARDVVLYGRDELTCSTCHNVHDQSTAKHETLRVLRDSDCTVCHDSVADLTSVIPYQPYGEVCQYSASAD